MGLEQESDYYGPSHEYVTAVANKRPVFFGIRLFLPEAGANSNAARVNGLPVLQISKCIHRTINWHCRVITMFALVGQNVSFYIIITMLFLFSFF